MPDKIWEPNEHDFSIARSGIELQREMLSEKEFIDNQVEVTANLYAEIRFLRNILHENLVKKD